VTEQRTDWRGAGDKIERLLDDLATAADPSLREKIEELMSTTVELYGATLRRALEIVFDSSGGAELIDRLADDELIGSMLILHDLHPYDLPTRIERALADVRPYLGSHEGDVELLDITDEGVVRLRLKGSCEGCPSSTVTLRLAIERAILEAAPEVVGIEAEGVDEPEETPLPPGGLLQIGMSAPPAAEVAAPPGAGQWRNVAELDDLSAGSVTVKDLDGARVFFCKVDDDILAYRDLCPACARNIAAGLLEGEVLTCPSCGEAYDVRRAGRAVDPQRAGSLHLGPVPLLKDDGVVQVAVPG
jgi:Fe-S cluster biogenesis protein NfuA/nitrite reductase/ring-hydroxylating ferredoxin subunit